MQQTNVSGVLKTALTRFWGRLKLALILLQRVTQIVFRRSQPLLARMQESRGGRAINKVLDTLEVLARPFWSRIVARIPFLQRLRIRLTLIVTAGVIIFTQLLGVLQPYLLPHAYALGSADSLLLPVSQPMAAKLKLDTKTRTFTFNKDYVAPTSDNAGNTTSQATASVPADASKGISVTDTANKVDFTLTPQFETWQGRQDGNRVTYPLKNGKGWLVYSMHTIGVKEDILLNEASGNEMSFDYKLGLKSGLEARMEKDGSIGIYGNPLFSGNIASGSAKDTALLEKARQNADKTTLLFAIPAPIIKETGTENSKVKAAYELKDDSVKLTVKGLDKASYPLDIDPSIFVSSAQQFMNGNNETNIGFDVADQLIEKGQTTGARFDSWNSTRSLNNAIWQQGVAVAGGFIYTVGGNFPSGSTTVFNTQGAATYTVPTGFTSVTVKAWGGGGGGGGGGKSGGKAGGDGGGGGFIQTVLTVSPGESLNVYVAAGGTGGIKADGGAGGGGGGASSVKRGTTTLALAAGGAGGGGGDSRATSANGGPGGAGGGASGLTGTAGGTNGAGAGGSQTAGGAGGTGSNNGAAGTSLTGGGGGNGNSTLKGGGSLGGAQGGGNGGAGAAATGGGSNSGGSPGGGGGGAGFFGGGGGAGSSGGSTANSGGGGGGGSSFANGTSTTNTAGSGSTPGNSADTARNNAGTGGSGGAANANGTNGNNGLITISAGSGSTNTSDVTWAQFNSTSGSIDSPNPGSGTCGGWCTTSAYALPAARSSLSLVAYNGFLYALGGEDSGCTTAAGTGDSGICKTVYIAKLGANGEPQLWSPTSTDKTTWSYWYRDADLTTPRSMITAVAYNNRLYLMGGKTSSGGTVSVANSAQVTDITATGRLGSWSSQTNLPVANYGYGAQVYNDRIYLIGGASSVGGAPLSTVYYNKISSSGTLNSWVQTSSLTGGRMTEGGNFTSSWGGYIYLSGGCAAVNASGYCTSMASDTQLASINTDGSLDTWGTDAAVADGRMGHNVVAWQNFIYEIGGCTIQSLTTGICATPLDTIKYGTINEDGDVSSVTTSVANGTAPCSGANATNCDLPPAGTGTGQSGQMMTASAVINGYLYIAGGCYTASCGSLSNTTSYAKITSTGTLVAPSNCTAVGNNLAGAWCVDSTHSLNFGNNGNGNQGVAAAATTVFNNTIYFVGGLNGNGLTGFVYYTHVNNDGSLPSTGWSNTAMATAGATSVAYAYAYARSNPSAAGSTLGNIFIMGGCTGVTGLACTAYTDAVYKCDIQTSGAIANCSTNGQLQIGTITGANASGLAGMGGTVYANYVYLIGGAAPGLSAADTVYYAKINDSNNIVAGSGSAWTLASNRTATASSYASAYGYNGYLYVVGGYNSNNGVLGAIQFAKIDVSTGNTSSFNTSSTSISPRWGMGVPISNSYAFVLGGCSAGAPPNSCSSLQPKVQSFQMFNNDSGAPAGYSTSAQTYATDPSRLGASSTVLNGYLYVAGGCTSATDCTTASNNVSYAALDANGTVGAWTSTTALPAALAWGKLQVAGGSLYYIGGQDGSGAASANVYYATPSSGNISSWGTASSGLPAARTKLAAAVWNNRLYAVGGNNSAGSPTATVYVSPQLNSGGNIGSAWSTSSTSFSVARSGLTAVAYSNNLYIFGGYDGSNYLSDSQYSQISTANGSAGGWSYSTSLPQPLSQSDGFAANGYLYLMGGRSTDTTCSPITLVAPISANTTIASGNNPTGIGQWYATSQQYSGNRYGASAVYNDGKAYILGGACGSTLTYASPVVQQTALLSQPQVAKYSLMLDTDTDVFPNQWLLNGLDNSIGAKWQLRYRSMTNPQNTANPCISPSMSTWGQETNFGDVTLGLPGVYTPKNGSGTNTNCARYFYFNVTVDSTQAFGYPDDISRGPTITDLTLQFTADPSKRLMHGRTFVGGLQQPDDTPYYSN
jgi:N-acetylneuraminic acid mutarotase